MMVFQQTIEMTVWLSSLSMGIVEEDSIDEPCSWNVDSVYDCLVFVKSFSCCVM